MGDNRVRGVVPDGLDHVSLLLRSKLRPPAAPDYFVHRSRLHDLLDEVASHPLTLVIAPAGSGKSQLVASWARSGTIPTAWLSLEEMDDDGPELWYGLIAALEELAPSCGTSARVLLARAAPLSDVVRALLTELDTASEAPCALVVDDVHFLVDDSTADSLALFVQHLPSWLHVVLVGRADPRLPLDRLRVSGQLLELRFAQLRLSADETRLVLAQLAPDLTEAELEEAAAHTDGWAAGVQLSALAARSERTELVASPARVGFQLLANDYVWHEVLAGGDPDVVDVMLKISVVDRVNAGLACAVADNPHASELLLRGESQGLFVHRLGSDGWFRVHALVREVLLGELIRQSKHTLCHERAAQWFENAGETVSALEQWLLAERPREALRLLSARSTELYDGGREDVIVRTVEAIPRHVVTTDASALVDFAVSHMVMSRSNFVDAVREATWHAERSGDVRLLGQISALRAVALTMQGDWTAGSTLARQALVELGESWWRDPAGRFTWNTAARGAALSERWDDTSEVVRDATLAMSRDAERGLSLEGVRSLGEALAGRPIDALRVAAGVRHAAARMSILRSELAIAEAIARREIGDRARALDELRAIAEAPPAPRLYCTMAAVLELALAAADEGDGETASHEFDRARSMLAEENGGPDLYDWVARAGATVALLRGRVDEAEQWAAVITDSFWAPVSRARVDLAIGNGAQASERLSEAVPRCVRHVVVKRLLQARCASTTDESLQHVTHAVELASSNGLLQTVASNGSELMELIERAAWRVSGEWLDRLRIAVAQGRIPAQAMAKGFGEPLTERERDVLRLLPSRLTLTEIAKELYVSVNTLKFHLRIIYRKLGVSGRDEAAAVARSLTKVRPRSSD